MLLKGRDRKQIQVMGAPRRVFNESTFVDGAAPEPVFLKAVLEAAAVAGRE